MAAAGSGSFTVPDMTDLGWVNVMSHGGAGNGSTDDYVRMRGNPVFSIVAITKNEAAVIGSLLSSVAPYIGHWAVLDTGSGDGTQDVIRQALASIPGELVDGPFINFGSARSRAFAMARGTADWLLALDADMAVEIDDDFEPDPAVDAYMVKMGSADFEYRLPLLLRGDLEWKSVGAVHEYTTRADGIPYTSAVTDKVRVSYPHDRSSREKSLWHASLLEAELIEQPDNARTVFYLAQSYADLGDPRALGLYQRRAEMGGWPEEVFYAKYKAATLQSNWPDRLAGLLAAWEFRPTRLEPLHAAIKELNSRGEHHVADRLAQAPVVPTDDLLFVHKGVWAWGMDFEKAISAWWCGRKEECRVLTEQVLSIEDLPLDIRAAAEANLALC